ncbi:MAG: glycosyltransferase family 4 protein [Proteobacteria bacterium]|nr:glycosyltransferase family 4 protein [Pseudomonadota bacterium]
MSRPPRLLALLTDGYGAQGGIARYNQDLFDALADAGAECFIAPRHGDASGVVLPRGVTQEAPAFGRLRYVARCLLAARRHRPFDAVFCGHVYMVPLAWMLARLLGARLWLQAHGAEVLEVPGALSRRAVEAADLVTVVSRATRHTLLSWASLAPERVRVLPDTVRDMFEPGPPSEALRSRLGFGPGPVLLTVGRLSSAERYKGHEQVFAALPALRARFPTLVHVVAGDGDDRARLEARAAELAGESAAVRFVGYIPEADLPDLYRSADLYVMPSTKEGFGIVYLEAAACGLRVVGGVGGGSGDAVPGEQIGVLVDSGDGKALEQAIVRLLAMGRADPEAVAPYRRDRFATAAKRLLSRLMAHPRRMKGQHEFS